MRCIVHGYCLEGSTTAAVALRLEADYILQAYAELYIT